MTFIVSQMFLQIGKKVRNFDGGTRKWEAAGEGFIIFYAGKVQFLTADGCNHAEWKNERTHGKDAERGTRLRTVCKGPIGFLSFSARNETNFGNSKGFLWFEAKSEELQASEQREKGKEIAR